MGRRSFGDLMGVYRRDGKIRFGRAPFMSEEDWRSVENPSRGMRVLQAIGLAYRPDRTRRTPFGETRD